MATTQKSDQVRPLRKLIHLAGAVFPSLYLFYSRQLVLIVALNVLAIVAAIEVGRRQWPAMEQAFEQLLGPALRSGEERKPTTGIWSLMGIIFSIIIFDRAIAIAGMFFAQVGDPAAEVAGQRWGRPTWTSATASFRASSPESCRSPGRGSRRCTDSHRHFISRSPVALMRRETCHCGYQWPVRVEAPIHEALLDMFEFGPRQRGCGR